MRILTDYSQSKQQAHINIMTNLIEDARPGHEFDICGSEKPPRYSSPGVSNSSLSVSCGGGCGSTSISKREPQRESYVDMDKLMKAEAEEAEARDEFNNNKQQQHNLELSYVNDSRWKPHLSWSFLSWSLKQRMEEQAAERELKWQKISDKLSPLLVADRALTFGQPDLSSKSAEERAYERLPIISNNNKHNLHLNYDHQRQAKARSHDHLNHYQSLMKNEDDQLKGGLRFMTVSGSLIFLILLLITIISLMALGVIPYSAKFQ